MRSAIWLGCLLSAACAASGRPPGNIDGSPFEAVVVTDRGENVRIVVDRTPSEQRMAAPVKRAWAALADVYDALGIPLGFADPRAYRAGNEQFVLVRRAGNDPLSKFFRCGLGPAGALADRGRITAAIITELRPLGTDSTLVLTQLQARAAAVDGTNTEPVICATTGALESAIVGLLIRRAAGSR
ncbi:MAG TPA: hypothetical protein VK864_12915 [Longimicrobiales bacterium]|nr:hypothetical protein [Longimicrobiales bacterium]